MRLNDIQDPGNHSPDEHFEGIKASIAQFGLWHPILVQGDSAPYRIIAGKKRYRAMIDLGRAEIEVKVYPSTAQNVEEMTLDENLRRANLPWYEIVELERQKHELRVSQHGIKRSGRPTDGQVGWSKNDTAKELGLALGTFNQDIQLAEALILNPHLAKVKDKTTALKLVKQTAKQQIAELDALAPTKFEFDQVYLGDSLSILRNLPSEIFDVCITDPPWSEYKDDSLKSEQIDLWPIFKEVLRVLKPEAFLYIITSSTDFPFYKEKLSAEPLVTVQGYPLIWQKAKTITHGRAPWQYARDHEPIILAVKGRPTLASGSEFSSIFNIPNVHSTKLVHPHEKPVDLIRTILKQCCYAGSKILDPFAGSGVVGSACKEEDRRYILIEKKRNFYDQIVRRLA